MPRRVPLSRSPRIAPVRAIVAVLATGIAALAVAAPAPKPTPPAPDFERNVRPVLADHCLACHGFDEAKRQGGLRLDAPLGKAQLASLKYRLALKPEAPGAMPPKSHPKPLSASGRATLRAWAESGARVRTHWAFVPPVRPALPAVRNRAWVRNGVDRFILARLEREGIAPAPEADRITLIRRVSLDLVGVPPTPAEIDAFLADTRPGAYERVVDRLLASPRYGERMAQAWLDGARYADSNGYQADYERFQWPWRDWVIDAFNRNLPFDLFTIEQLAGDLLPGATLSQRVATGFNRNHRINTEGGVIAEEWRVENVVDRLETTGAVWLALSIGCGRCHDHKYDPISQRDFYRLFHYFNNVPESGTGVESPVNHPPVVKVPGPDQAAAVAKADHRIADAKASAATVEAGLPARLAAWEARTGGKPEGTVWATPAPEVSARNGSRPRALDAGVIRSEPPAPDKETFVLRIPAAGRTVSGVRLELFPDERGRISRHDGGNIVLTDLSATVDGAPVRLAKATADYAQDGFPAAHAIDDNPNTGWGVYPRTDQNRTAVFTPVAPVRAGSEIVVRLAFESVYEKHYPTRFRVSLTESSDPHGAPVPEAAIAALAVPARERSAAQRAAAEAWFRSIDPESIRVAADVAAAEKEKTAVVEASPSVMVMDELPNPRKCYVLVRGQYDRRGEEVGPGIPTALGALPRGVPNNRLGFARWVASPDNPLTARVAVNRLWEKFFGVGIVATSEDFGVRADPPSHPELLDWL
ncbi:MAG: DUF1549 domain-containing protein, partial [Armatimonadota bacterium]